MERNDYINFLRWFRTEICEETPLSHEYFVDKYISNGCEVKQPVVTNCTKIALKNTADNRARIEALKTIKETQWTGTTIHTSIDACLTAMNLDSTNSGWYNPIPIRIPQLKGIFMINEDGTLFYEAKIIKESDNAYRIEYMTMEAYNKFEKKYSDLLI